MKNTLARFACVRSRTIKMQCVALEKAVSSPFYTSTVLKSSSLFFVFVSLYFVRLRTGTSVVRTPERF